MSESFVYRWSQSTLAVSKHIDFDTVYTHVIHALHEEEIRMTVNIIRYKLLIDIEILENRPFKWKFQFKEEIYIPVFISWLSEILLSIHTAEQRKDGHYNLELDFVTESKFYRTLSHKYRLSDFIECLIEGR